MICLIVDDSAVIRAVARALLERHGFMVLEAADGQEAAERCREFIPDVILLDGFMPNMDGPTFLRWLRHAAAGDRPKVVFSTTGAHPEVIAAAWDAGADEVLIKPFDAPHLIATFARVGVHPTHHAA